jgi:putative ABC transport system permease protein
VPVTAGYVEAIGARLVAGRSVDGRDRPDGEKVVVVSLSLAEKSFGSAAAAVGQSLRLVNQSERTGEYDGGRRIVGVVDDVKYRGLDSDLMDMVYTPLGQTPMSWAYLLVRTEGAPERMVGAIKAAIAEVAPEQPASNPRSLAAIVAESVEQPRFNMMLLGLFAFIALALSAIGLYGLVAYSVAQRTRDIGIRMALGADRGHVIGDVLGRSFTLVGSGAAAGLLLSIAAAQVLSGFLVGVSSFDPLSYAAALIVLGGAALVATIVPAKRAASINPIEALRSN